MVRAKQLFALTYFVGMVLAFVSIFCLLNELLTGVLIKILITANMYPLLKVAIYTVILIPMFVFSMCATAKIVSGLVISVEELREFIAIAIARSTKRN